MEQAVAAERVATGGLVGAVGGAGATYVGGMTANELAVYGGLTIAVLGLVVQIAGFGISWAYKRKHYKLAVQRQMQEPHGAHGANEED